MLQFSFKAEDKTFEEVLFSNRPPRFRMPRYQKPYAWSQEQAEGYWNDLIDTQSDKSTDIAPEPHSAEHTPYFETITFEAIGDVTSARKQTIMLDIYQKTFEHTDSNTLTRKK